MARPPYGGWVSFTAHLALKHKWPLFKIGNRTEKFERNFGYGVKYRNISIEDAKKLKNILITAIDKSKYEHLDKLPNGTRLVIHDPTEVKGASTQPVIDNLKRFKILTIRKTVQKYLKSKFNVSSKFLLHPFYKYPTSNVKKDKNVATSRIDFDKHTDIILFANKKLKKKDQIKIYGAKNNLYIYHYLKNKLKLNLDKHYGGTFPKSFEYLDSILKNAKYVVDMSAIKNDGGGSQYTFLEAIHQGAVLILNKKWVENTNSVLKNGKNCLVAETPEDIVKIINDKKINTAKIAKTAKKLLKPHTTVNWN